MKNRRTAKQKRVVLICIILAAASILVLCSCKFGAPKIDQAKSIIEELLPKAKYLMSLTDGDAMPVVAATEETKNYLYRDVASNAPYKTIDEFKVALEEVFSYNLCKSMYEYLFEGVDTGSVKRPKFGERSYETAENGKLVTKKMLTVLVAEQPRALSYEVSLDGAEVVSGNRMRARISALRRASADDFLRECFITIVKEKNTAGEMVWKLDSAVW